jgi:hypothetical protein
MLDHGLRREHVANLHAILAGAALVTVQPKVGTSCGIAELAWDVGCRICG